MNKKAQPTTLLTIFLGFSNKWRAMITKIHPKLKWMKKKKIKWMKKQKC